MNARIKNLLIIPCLLSLMTGCGNQPKIASITVDRVVVSAPADKFVAAYDLAKNECQKNTRNALYVPDANADLEVVAFDCLGQEVAAETQPQTDTEAEVEIDLEMDSQTETLRETQTEPDMDIEAEMEVETVPGMDEETEADLETEEVPAE